MVTILKGVFDHAPKEILRLITGGIFLGLVLLVFLKVVDDRFDLDPRHLDVLGLGATPILGLLLCIDIVPVRKRVLKVFCASLVIFAVGFASTRWWPTSREWWHRRPFHRWKIEGDRS